MPDTIGGELIGKFATHADTILTDLQSGPPIDLPPALLSPDRDIMSRSGQKTRNHTHAAPDRTRLSGPALRTFVRIADEWRLAERDRLAILGEPGRSTFHAWRCKAQAHAPLTLPLDTLIRLSAVLGISEATRLIFARPGDDLAWLTAPNAAPTFGGQSPMALITSGTQDGLLLVRRYLDAWRGGQATAPIAGADFEQTPIDDADLVLA
jgi:hypothetical protein